MLHLALLCYKNAQGNYAFYKEMIKTLLKRGASRDLKDKYGMTPVNFLDSFKSEI